MANLSKRNPFLFFSVLAVLISFGIGVFVGTDLVECEICPPEDVNFSLFWETYNVLKERFVYPERIDINKVIYGAISGMTESLDDPYTVFFNPEETEKFEEQLVGIYEGVGMEIGIKEDQLTVVAPLKGTPAQRAGLRAGDKILEVDGQPTSNISIEEAVVLIRGPEGTEVTLMISRKGWEKPREFKIRRAEIKIPPLEWEMMDQNTAYLHIYQFNQPLASEFGKVARDILSSGADKIILDLRNNPGGYLNIAVDIAGWFLEKDKVVVIEDSGKEQEKKAYKTDGNSKFLSYPVVVLINEGSASGAEILAEALRYQGKIKIVGQTSFGKGSIQEAIPLGEKSLLKVTIARWLTPSGVSISEVGIQPDIEVEITEEDFLENRDPQLEKAKEILNQL